MLNKFLMKNVLCSVKFLILIDCCSYVMNFPNRKMALIEFEVSVYLKFYQSISDYFLNSNNNIFV